MIYKDKEKVLTDFIVVIVDPETGNQSDFSFNTNDSWTAPLEHVIGSQVMDCAERLKERSPKK